MRELRVFVPSYNRFTVKEIEKGPLRQMPASLRKEAAYVVRPDQVDLYTLALTDLGYKAQVLSSPTVGIAAKRKWIGEYCQQNKIDKFLMLDDDIDWLIRRGSDTWRLRAAEGEEILQLLALIEQLLDKYGHVGVSVREGNNRHGVGDHTELLIENSRTIRALAYRTKDFMSVVHERVPVMEDLDVNIQLLRKGIPNVTIAYWAQGQSMTNAPGGCSSYRTLHVQEAAAKKLAELHPGLVRLRQKSNKTDSGGFGTRTEVTVSWKAAFKSTRGLLS